MSGVSGGLRGDGLAFVVYLGFRGSQWRLV